MPKILRILAAIMALAIGSEVRAEYVSADVVNCRSQPTTASTVIAKVKQGWPVSVIENKDEWSRLDTPRCWVLSRFLSSAFVATTPAAARGHASSTRRSPSNRAATPSQLYGKSSPAKSRSSRPSRSYDSGACPCSGSRVCIGPRGGRYCITSGGNKRYGV